MAIGLTLGCDVVQGAVKIHSGGLGEQVVGAFLESGSGEENAAMKKVADLRPDAPSNLESEGLAFASKL